MTKSGPNRAFLAPTTAVIGSISVALTILLPNLSAEFGPIDDHEIHEWIGGSSHLSSRDYVDVLLTTEVGAAGETPRFRPAYYSIRVAQAMVWGDAPLGWYATVLMVFTATIAALALASFQWISRSLPQARVARSPVVTVGIVVLLVFLFASLPMWEGVVTRLGPSEQLALLGAAITILGATWLCFGSSKWWWIPTVIGTSVALLSKENFVPLALLPLVVAIYRIRIYQCPRSELAVSSVPILSAALLAWGVAPGLLRSASDVYGQGIDQSRLSGSITSLLGTYLFYWAPALGVLILSWFAAFWNNKGSRSSDVVVGTFILIGIAWLFFDSFVYRGEYSLPRYWAIFQLLKTIAIVGAVSLSILALRRNLPLMPWFSLPVFGMALVLLTLQISLIPTALREIRAEALYNQISTAAYRVDMDQVRVHLSDSSISSVIIIVENSVDYEPAVAIATEVGRFSHHPPAVLMINPSRPSESFRALEDLALRGNPRWFISAFSSVDTSGRNLCVFINHDPELFDVCGGPNIRVDAVAK